MIWSPVVRIVTTLERVRRGELRMRAASARQTRSVWARASLEPRVPIRSRGALILPVLAIMASPAYLQRS